MNVALDLYVLGWLLALLGGAYFLPLAAALGMGEASTPWAVSAAIALVSGLALARASKPRTWRMHPRDGFLVVVAGWLAVSAFGALPYVLTGVLGPVDAWFESVSGFTTTGSTVMTGLEHQPRAVLLWRSLTQWFGGMGIILFTIAVLPLLGVGGMQLFRAEVPGPIADKLAPRLTVTARRLWFVYVGLTALQVLALLVAGLDGFDALCHAFTTLATGGFSTRDLSVGAFGSPLVEWIVTVFMLLAGMNFVLHYRLVVGQFGAIRRDAELKYYVTVVLAASAVVIGWLALDGRGVEAALRLGAFQVASIVTTTGFVTADFERWAPLTHLVFIVLMVLGGMSGSTSGGVKSLRTLLGLRSLDVTFHRLVHPHVMRSVKYAGRPVADDVLGSVWAFFTGYFLIAILGTVCMTAGGYDLETSFSATLTALGNVGPGLGEIGAYDNFTHLPAALKMVLSLCMIAGRLEVFTLVVVMLPRFWRR